MVGRGVKTTGAVIGTYVACSVLLGSNRAAIGELTGYESGQLTSALTISAFALMTCVGILVWTMSPKKPPKAETQMRRAIDGGLKKIDHRVRECSARALLAYADGTPTNAIEHIGFLRHIAQRAVLRADFDTVLACDFYMQAFDGSLRDIPEEDLPRLLAVGLETNKRLLNNGLVADAKAFGLAGRAALKHRMPDMEVD